MSQLTVTRKVEVAALPSAVWTVISTPSYQPVLEPRARLVSDWGRPATTGSGFELRFRGRSLRYRVVDAEPGRHYRVDIEANGRSAASQAGDITATDTGCLLTWTVELTLPRLLHRLVRSKCNRELSLWLDAVAIQSVSLTGR